MTTDNDKDIPTEQGDGALPAYAITTLDSLEGALAKAQSVLVGQLVEINNQYYKVVLSRHDVDMDELPLQLTCQVAGAALGVAFYPDFSRGWLGDNQITRQQLENPLIAAVYADHLASEMPQWISNVQLGDMLRSAIQFNLALLPAQNRDAAPICLSVTVEGLDALHSVFDQIQHYCVLAEHQRLDHFEVALPLVAANVTLSSEELAALMPSDIIRLT